MTDAQRPTARRPLVSRDPVDVRRRLEQMERMLEDLVTVPGTNRRVGLDAVIGLVPVVGDIAGAAFGAYLLWEARNLGMGKLAMTRMTGRIGLDTTLGAIPFAGDLFDLVYRSNTRNLKTIRKHLDRHHPDTALIEGEATVT